MRSLVPSVNLIFLLLFEFLLYFCRLFTYAYIIHIHLHVSAVAHPLAAFSYVYHCFVTDSMDLWGKKKAPLTSESYELFTLRLFLAPMSRDIQTILLLSHETLVSFTSMIRCSVSVKKGCFTYPGSEPS